MPPESPFKITKDLFILFLKLFFHEIFRYTKLNGIPCIRVLPKPRMKLGRRTFFVQIFEFIVDKESAKQAMVSVSRMLCRFK